MFEVFKRTLVNDGCFVVIEEVVLEGDSVLAQAALVGGSHH
jgi:hypothetical protein